MKMAGGGGRAYLLLSEHLLPMAARGISSKKPRNINRSQQNFQMDFVLMASLYAKLKGG